MAQSSFGLKQHSPRLGLFLSKVELDCDDFFCMRSNDSRLSFLLCSCHFITLVTFFHLRLNIHHKAILCRVHFVIRYSFSMAHICLVSLENGMWRVQHAQC